MIGKLVLGLDYFGDLEGLWGYVVEVFNGKDMLFGYWEIVGVLVLFDWGYFLDMIFVFFVELIDVVSCEVDLMGILGDKYVFGMEIIVELGEEYVWIGKFIYYMFVDSVI